MRGLGRWRRLCLRSVRTELRLPHSMCPQSAASRPWGCWEGFPEPGWGVGGGSTETKEEVSAAPELQRASRQRPPAFRRCLLQTQELGHQESVSSGGRSPGVT